MDRKDPVVGEVSVFYVLGKHLSRVYAFSPVNLYAGRLN